MRMRTSSTSRLMVSHSNAPSLAFFRRRCVFSFCFLENSATCRRITASSAPLVCQATCWTDSQRHEPRSAPSLSICMPALRVGRGKLSRIVHPSPGAAQREPLGPGSAYATGTLTRRELVYGEDHTENIELLSSVMPTLH
eukprot:COSAG02_NODE_624_length_19387_cov_90.736002_6_plen_140_part_00